VRGARAGDNGSMCFWDVKSATCFQRRETIVQPGSLDSEMGIFASTFDKSGSRLITCEADKTIKVWRVRAVSVRWYREHLPPVSLALFLRLRCGSRGIQEDETAIPPHEL